MTSSSRKIRQLVETETLAVLGSELADEVSEFVRKSAYRRFRPDETLQKRVALHEAIRVYLGSGDRRTAEEAVEQGLDTYVLQMELEEDVSRSSFFPALSARVLETISARHPQLVGDGTSEIVGRTTLGYVAERVLKADPSSPLDISTGKQVTVCYIPGSSRTENYWDIATTSWLTKSDSLSIYPDRTFLDFLSVVGLNKSEWLAAVDRNLTSTAISRMDPHHADRIEAWQRVEDWEAIGSLEVDVDDVVAAVDSCPYGFTPMIAFTMDAEEVFAMDFTETLEVTGGIVGLHDFTNGSGDPIRFEGTLRLSPAAGDMHLADDQPLGLIATHGFLSSSFRSTVQRVAETCPRNRTPALSP